jgi:ribosomal protein S27AE
MKDMVSWKFKKCPRCGGDLFMDSDMDGWYEQCLQCSYRHDLQPLTQLKGTPIKDAKAAEAPDKSKQK